MLRGYLLCTGVGAAVGALAVAGAYRAGWFVSEIVYTLPEAAAPQMMLPELFLRPQDGSPGVDELRKRLGASGRVVFRSNDGIAYRTDDDWEITFRREPDRGVDILRYGFDGPHNYRGKYELSADGRVKFTGLSGDLSAWLPEFLLQGRHGALLLLPNSSNLALSQQQTFYFRRLTGDDEQEAFSESGTRPP